jgi:hypothetical protein
MREVEESDEKKRGGKEEREVEGRKGLRGNKEGGKRGRERREGMEGKGREC